MSGSKSTSGPVGQLLADFDQLHAMGCIQTGADVHEDRREAFTNFGAMFHGLMAATRLNMCDGCLAYHGGSCKAFKRYHTASLKMRVIERRESAATVSVANRCPKCGFRRRGANHDEGHHHKNGRKRRP